MAGIAKTAGTVLGLGAQVAEGGVPWAQIGGVALSGLNKILGKKDIAPDKEDYMPSEASKSTTRQNAGRAASRMGEAAMQRIMGSGAAGGQPAASTAAQLGGVAQGQAEAATGIESTIAQQEQAGQARYAQAKQQAVMGAKPLNLTPEIGNLTGAMMMYMAGLKKPGERDGTGEGTGDPLLNGSGPGRQRFSPGATAHDRYMSNMMTG